MTAGDSSVEILVVDDLPPQRLALEAALAELGERVVAVASGFEALRYLVEHEVAVIILDVNMPGMDGFETASLIRQRPRSRHTPIVFVTADANDMREIRGYSVGAVDYLSSPIVADVLRAKVRVFVELTKLHEQVKRDAEQRIALEREQAARTAAEAEARRLRVLADASGSLACSLETSAVVSNLLGLLVPAMADLAGVALRPPSGAALPGSWLHAEPGGAIRAPEPDAISADALDLVGRAVASERAALISDARGRVRGLAVPLAARTRPLGAVAALRRPPWPPFNEADLELVRLLASRAEVALDNAQLHEEIKQRDAQKDEFLALLGHELRNPVGAIGSAAHVLGRLEARDPRAVRAREVIARQVAHLGRMVDDLLDVARVTRGQITLARRPLNLRELAERAVEVLRVSDAAAERRLTCHTEDVLVDADPSRLEQILTNLLVNAVKYTKPADEIEIEVHAEEDEAVVRVRDSGIGIPPELLPQLFQPFVQGLQPADRARGGLGIGLALVRRLVELHGGRVSVASEGRHCGSTFTVRLPRLRTEPAEDLIEAGPAPAPSRRRVLIVEDNDDAREMLRVALELEQHDVHAASDGESAIAAVANLRPEVAVIDLGLPTLDGYEVARRIRGLPEGARIRLVALTGYGQPEDRRRALDAGFDAHLTKPVDRDRLVSALFPPDRLSAARQPEWPTPAS